MSGNSLQPRHDDGRSTIDDGRSSVVCRPSSNETALDGVIADLQRRHQQLSDYIDEHKDEMRAGQFITAIDYQGRLANRIGRLLRDRQQLVGERADALDEAVAEALAIVGEAWGVALAPLPPQGGEGERAVFGAGDGG